MRLLEHYQGKIVVVLAGRYVWLGEMGEYSEPLFELKNARQVVDHDWPDERDGADCGPCLLNLAAVEGIYLADAMDWSKKIAQNRPGAAKKAR